ncbi:putative DNA binding domain-containing protein [Candidatus Bipolaricaulota bacterium]|nr:putative DNA binding domain-containing protein [Candidatus Bipolaricaulota bacterium]
MNADRDNDYLVGLVRELCSLPHETEWLEFKGNNSNPQEIGEYISALANSAALNGKASGYLAWGIENETHEITGTTFSPFARKKGNEPLETWLLVSLSPRIHFRFFEFLIGESPIVLLEISRAFRHPVRFRNQAFIRVGEVKKPLKDVPERERALWRILDQTPFENLQAAERVSDEEVLKLLDYPSYFELLEQPLPANRDGILEALCDDQLIVSSDAGGWCITNLGAILFARKLSDFAQLKRKATRVVQYRDESRMEAVREQEGVRGYASGFEGLVGYINDLLPANEVIGQALRENVPMFPPLAVRELVANALIHQDLFVKGAGPMVEIFANRIEISNPGEPLVSTERFVDTPPKSRNDLLASLMRRLRICEERGSGIDKVVFQIELFQLPAPIFEAPNGFTRTVLFAHKPLTAMDKEDRVRACYLHACLKYVMRDYLTNSSLRERFGIEAHNRSTVSRLIREAVESNAICPYDASAAPKLMKYVPWWAVKPKDERQT